MRRIAYIVAAALAAVALAVVMGRRLSGVGDSPAAVESAHVGERARAGARAGAGAIPEGSESSAERVAATQAAPTAERAPAPEPAAQHSPTAQPGPAAETAPGGQPATAVDAAPEVEASSERSEAQADAAAILRRAADVYEKVNTISAEFTQRLQNRLLRPDARSRGRLYQRHPDRFLMRFEEPAGDVIVSDGRYFWLYYPSVDSLQVMRAPAGMQGSSGVDLRSQFVGDPLERFDATLHGREAVGGRDAHVLTLVPKQPQGYERLRVWVDDRDHLVRRFEITEENGNVRLIELHDLQINRALGDELFRFTPPPNARIVDRG